MKRIPGWTLPVVALGLALAAPKAVSAQAKPLPQGVTAAMVETGKGLYHAAALCANCHGQNGEGSGIAPNLADKTWLHSDGSYAAIVKQINDGVPAPKESMIPMLPKGGSGITADQVNAVAAYVWSLSNK
jgi:cytochrome c oxidase cbb3-type subunit 3